MSDAATIAVPEDYLALVRAFPLAHIRDDEHLKAAIAVGDALTERTLSPGEDMYFQALCDLIETYETAHSGRWSAELGLAAGFLQDGAGG